MIQQRKKDYLQRLIEEFFAKLHQLEQSESESSVNEKRQLVNNCLSFFIENFDTQQSDSAYILASKIGQLELLEQYAKLLCYKYEIVDIKEREQLITALNIIEYLEAYDKTYSWDRTILKEDILRLLDDRQ